MYCLLNQDGPTGKNMNTPSVWHQRERQIGSHWIHCVQGDAWEWVRDRFWSVTMYFNGMVPLPPPLTLDARCVHSLKQKKLISAEETH